MVRTKYVNRVYNHLKECVEIWAMIDASKKSDIVGVLFVDHIIYELCDTPFSVSRDDVLREVASKLKKKGILLEKTKKDITRNGKDEYRLSWHKMSMTKIKLKLYFNQYFDLEHILSYSLISFIAIMVLCAIFILALVAIKYGIVQLLLVLLGVLGTFVAMVLIGAIIGMICAVDLGYKRYKQKHNKGRD